MTAMGFVSNVSCIRSLGEIAVSIFTLGGGDGSSSNFAVLALATHSVIPLYAGRRWRDVARADDEVAEVLAVETLEGVPLDHGLQDRKDLRLRHGFWRRWVNTRDDGFIQGIHTSVNLVHPLAVVSSAKEQHVRARGLADEGDLSEVWSGAPVRTTSHTHDDGVVAEAILLAELLDLVDEDREVLKGFVGMDIK